MRRRRGGSVFGLDRKARADSEKANSKQLAFSNTGDVIPKLEASFVLGRFNERGNHLGVGKIAIELIQLVQPEVITIQV